MKVNVENKDIFISGDHTFATAGNFKGDSKQIFNVITGWMRVVSLYLTRSTKHSEIIHGLEALIFPNPNPNPNSNPNCNPNPKGLTLRPSSSPSP